MVGYDDILKYQITIYDNQNLNTSLCNILIEAEDDKMNMYSINYFNDSADIYQFQMICRNYIKRLIEDYPFIFEIIFGVIPTNYITKFIRVVECKFDNGFFEVGSTNKKRDHSITSMDFYDYLTYDEQKQPPEDLIRTTKKLIKTDSNENNKTVYKFNFIIKNEYVITFNDKETNKYEITNLNDSELFEYKDRFSDYECFYKNKNIYAIQRNGKDNNQILYYNDKVICYHKIIWTLYNAYLLNDNIVLLERDCKINNELNLLSNPLNNKSVLRHCLKTEFGDTYSNVAKFMIQPIYDIDN